MDQAPSSLCDKPNFHLRYVIDRISNFVMPWTGISSCVCLSVCLSSGLCICLSDCLSSGLCICLSDCLSLWSFPLCFWVISIHQKKIENLAGRGGRGEGGLVFASQRRGIPTPAKQPDIYSYPGHPGERYFHPPRYFYVYIIYI